MKTKAVTGIVLTVLVISMLILAFNIDEGYALADDPWSIETVDSAGDVGLYTSIALDSNNRPHISYLDYTLANYKVKYAYYTSGVWSIETVDSLVGVGGYTSIAIDSNNNPHISYYDLDDLKYAHTYALAVGGIWVPVDKFGLLAPYIGLTSTIVVATAATAIYVKRVKRRKEKQ